MEVDVEAAKEEFMSRAGVRACYILMSSSRSSELPSNPSSRGELVVRCDHHSLVPSVLAQQTERGQKKTEDFLSGMGLGMLAGPLKDLKLGELLDNPPPGLDEGVAIAKVPLHDVVPPTPLPCPSA